MKQWITVLLVCVLIMSSCSASQEESSVMPDHSSVAIDMKAVQSNYNVYGRSLMCELNDVYYYMVNTSIYYYDQATGQSGVLCGKPECSHNDTLCNGHIGYQHFIAAYDDHIYCITGSLAGFELFRIDPDGTNREKVRSLESIAMTNSRVYIHQGYIYASGSEQQVVDGRTSTTFQLYQYELDSDKEPILLLEETHEFIEIAHYHFVEDQIYLLIPYVENEERTLSINRIDIESRQREELWSGDSEGRVSNFFVENNVMYISNKLEDKGKEIRILEFDIGSGTLEKGKKLKFFKGTYNISSEYINFTADMSNIYTIMDHRGKVIDEGSFVEEKEGTTIAIECSYMGEDAGALFFRWTRGYEMSGKQYYEVYVLRWTTEGTEILTEYKAELS